MEYTLHITPDGEVANLYWGEPVGPIVPDLLKDYPHHKTELEYRSREIPDIGRGDRRIPALKIYTPTGQTMSRFRYAGHQIIPGKPQLEGLPSFFANPGEKAQTLQVTLRDEVTKLELELFYTVFAEQNVVIRSSRLTNKSNLPVSIEKLASLSVDFNPDDYRLLKHSGNTRREGHEDPVTLQPGTFRVESQDGRTGHGQNPFMALYIPETTEDAGNAYGFALAYSGSFVMEAHQGPEKYTRLMMGLNPEVFRWNLAPDENFQTPEAIGVFSSQGMRGLTRQLHQTFRQNLIRSEWKKRPAPVKLNLWEAVYFDFDHDKVVNVAREAKKLGVELVVLDDGWFGGTKYPRNDDDQGLGDWIPNPEKLPNGIEGLGKEINELGLMFGLWVEPEMVNPKSELYEKHPDWVIHQPGRNRTEMRNQLMLDLSRREVQDYIIDFMSKILDTGRVQYIKWDMNRAMTETGSAGLPPDRQMETQHRYMLGLYRVLDMLTKKYPKVLFENCASGGGRFDPGMLYYFPQTWTSDNTDALSRLDIQAGMARIYPVKSMGAHVSQVPNHQVYRTTSLKSRFHVAMSANMGLELDPTCMSEDERAYVREQIALYKKIRHIVQDGEYTLLRNPSESNWPAWMFATSDGSEALVFAFQKREQARVAFPRIKLKELDKNALYSVSGIGSPLNGAYLMNIGLSPDFQGDMDSNLFHIKRLSGG